MIYVILEIKQSVVSEPFKGIILIADRKKCSVRLIDCFVEFQCFIFTVADFVTTTSD